MLDFELPPFDGFDQPGSSFEQGDDSFSTSLEIPDGVSGASRGMTLKGEAGETQFGVDESEDVENIVAAQTGEYGRNTGLDVEEPTDSLLESYLVPDPVSVGRSADPQEQYAARRGTSRRSAGDVTNRRPDEGTHVDQASDSDGGEPPKGGEAAEASDDEHERALDESIAFAKSTAVIHTSVPGDAVATLVAPERPYGGGFMSFGEGRGVPSEGRRSSNFQRCGLHEWNDGLPDSCEAISFFAAKETVYEQREVEVPVARSRARDMLNMKPKTVKQMQPVAVGEKQHMVVNPGTGEEEPGVWVDYEYNARQLRREPDYDEPKYVDSTMRRNILRVQTLLSASLAQGLRQAVRHQPARARTFAEQLARNGGISQSLWDHPLYPAQPPYDEQPIYIVTPSDRPTPDGKRYLLERLLPRR
jgi:hypothetical protein